MTSQREDNYAIARDAALQKLRAGLEPARLEQLGAKVFQDGALIVLPALCWELHVRPEPYSMLVMPEELPVRIAWQILALNYLASPKPVAPRGFRSFADFAEARSYQPAYQGRVVERLSHTVGREAGPFLCAARRLGATPTGDDPVRCIFRFFPLLELEVVRYEADEDFPASCNVLLSDNAAALFSLEDAIVAAEMLVSALGGKTPATLGPCG